MTFGLQVPEVTRHNHAALARALSWWQKRQAAPPAQVLLLSPNRHDVLFIARLWPAARLIIVTRREWDLNQPPALGVGPFDLTIASNVFHYSSAPQLWARHVLMISPCLVLQDLIDRRRGPMPPHLGSDGDIMRYSYSGDLQAKANSPLPQAFDLARMTPPPVYFEAFEAAGSASDDARSPARHFCAVLLAVDPGSAPRSYLGVDAPAPPPQPSPQPQRALAAWAYRLRLQCHLHWPLYVVYKLLGRLIA